MKKTILLLAMLLTISLSACSNQDLSPAPADEGSNAPSQPVATLEAGVWPANAYTQGLPVPPGTVAWATLDAEQGNCCVNLTDVGETEYEEYIETLKQEGFSVVENVSEQIQGQDYVSIGTLYLKEDKWISISYMPDSFMIYISLEGQQ